MVRFVKPILINHVSQIQYFWICWQNQDMLSSSFLVKQRHWSATHVLFSPSPPTCYPQNRVICKGRSWKLLYLKLHTVRVSVMWPCLALSYRATQFYPPSVNSVLHMQEKRNWWQEHMRHTLYFLKKEKERKCYFPLCLHYFVSLNVIR